MIRLPITMKSSYRRVVLLSVLSAMSLAACSSGHSSGSGAVVSNSGGGSTGGNSGGGSTGGNNSGTGFFGETAQLGTTYTGPTQTATLSSGLTVDNGGTAGTVSITPNTSGSGVVFSASNTGGNVSLSSNGTETLAGVSTHAETGITTGGDTLALNAFGAADNLTYSEYGFWSLAPSSGVTNVGVFATGSLTPTSSMPTSGTATYTGGATGAATTASGTGVFSGTASLSANFASNTLTGSITGINDYNPGTQALNGTLNNINLSGGTISGNGFSGTAAAAATAGTAGNLSGASGTFKGNFYGTAAAEAAGVFEMTGGGNQVIGAFGVHK